MLPAAFRLRFKGDFSRAYRRGKVYAYPHFVLYCCRRGAGQPRVGFSVSKKVGKAVIRNRVKRRFRHAVAGLSPKLRPGWDYVFVVRPSAAAAGYEQLQAELARAVDKAGRA